LTITAAYEDNLAYLIGVNPPGAEESANNEPVAMDLGLHPGQADPEQREQTPHEHPDNNERNARRRRHRRHDKAGDSHGHYEQRRSNDRETGT
jgi:hypothetical protein